MRKLGNVKYLIIAMVIAVAAIAGCSGSKEGKTSEDNISLAKNEVKLGIEKVENGDLDNGMAHFQKAMAYDSTNSRAWCGMGTIYRLREKYDEAIEHYSKALELNPEYQICLDNMGVAYTYKGDAETALEYFTRAVAIDDTYADVYFNMGVLYNREGDSEKVVKNFEKYLKLSTDEKKKSEVEAALSKLKLETTETTEETSEETTETTEETAETEE